MASRCGTSLETALTATSCAAWLMHSHAYFICTGINTPKDFCHQRPLWATLVAAAAAASVGGSAAVAVAVAVAVAGRGGGVSSAAGAMASATYRTNARHRAAAKAEGVVGMHHSCDVATVAAAAGRGGEGSSEVGAVASATSRINAAHRGGRPCRRRRRSPHRRPRWCSPPPSVPNADFNKGMKLLPYDKEDELQKHFNGTKLIGDFNGTAPSSSGFDRCRQSMPCRTTFLFRTTSLAAALLTPDGGIHLGHCWPFRER
ncbi:hypothetical protein G6O67_006694 [Ophiocordyceps sinensis]|uniref:Uncharacterized protein n=1 Tax=Ophiocordyceps sinensis TaxID=72228 RepID=A0A8H4LW22_9HYPO|nr:hypothetical protein G6O67_006694 [Ophiocordyceps sinensis]